jgi:hypothetical protein
MTTSSTTPGWTRAVTARAILWGGLIAGLLDLGFASIYWQLHGVGPAGVLRGIATGLLGSEAFRGGAWTAGLGLALFWVIVGGAAIVYVLAARRLDLLQRRPVPCGLAFGALVNLFMTYVVVPLSAARPGSMPLSQRLVVLLGCAVCVGLPIALAVNRFGPAGEGTAVERTGSPLHPRSESC